jgi:hypothetical protein
MLTMHRGSHESSVEQVLGALVVNPFLLTPRSSWGHRRRES